MGEDSGMMRTHRWESEREKLKEIWTDTEFRTKRLGDILTENLCFAMGHEMLAKKELHKRVLIMRFLLCNQDRVQSGASVELQDNSFETVSVPEISVIYFYSWPSTRRP